MVKHKEECTAEYRKEWDNQDKSSNTKTKSAGKKKAEHEAPGDIRGALVSRRGGSSSAVDALVLSSPKAGNYIDSTPL
jgi:hypothetical protein